MVAHNLLCATSGTHSLSATNKLTTHLSVNKINVQIINIFIIEDKKLLEMILSTKEDKNFYKKKKINWVYPTNDK